MGTHTQNLHMPMSFHQQFRVLKGQPKVDIQHTMHIAAFQGHRTAEHMETK